jgi:hypothetical protein
MSLRSSANARLWTAGPEPGSGPASRQGWPVSCRSREDFIARLAAPVPNPRVNLPRFHGVFAPNSRYRGRVTRAKRGRGGRHCTTEEPEEPTPAERRASMSWAQRLKWVFGIDIGIRPTCGGAVRIIACIEDPVVIEKIVAHPDEKRAGPEPSCRPPPRVCPVQALWSGYSGGYSVTADWMKRTTGTTWWRNTAFGHPAYKHLGSLRRQDNPVLDYHRGELAASNADQR